MNREIKFMKIHISTPVNGRKESTLQEKRKDGYVKPYWLRIRSNPYRRNYH